MSLEFILTDFKLKTVLSAMVSLIDRDVFDLIYAIFGKVILWLTEDPNLTTQVRLIDHTSYLDRKRILGENNLFIGVKTS